MSAHSGQVLDQAILAAVDAALPPSVPVFLSRPPRTSNPPYAVLHSLPGTADGSISDQSLYFGTYQVTSVGTGPEQAAGIADAVRQALVMATPTVTGRVCGAIQLSTSLGVTTDEDVTGVTTAASEPIYLARDQYTVPTSST